MKLSMNEIAYVAARHWSGDDLAIAVAVGWAESAGEVEAIGYVASDNQDLGVWQISTKWHAAKLLPVGAKWRDPYVNAALAKAVFDEFVRQGKVGWQAWAVFNSGAYTKHLPAARRAVLAPWAPPRDLSIALGSLDGTP